MPWFYLFFPVALLFSSLSHSAQISCDKINFSQDFSISFQVEGGNDDQFINLYKNQNFIVQLWAAKSAGSGLGDYIFEQENLVDGAIYEILISSKKSGNLDFMTYNIRSIYPAYSAWTANNEVASFSGNHDATGENNDGLINNTLKCSNEVVEPDDPIDIDACSYFPQPAQGWENNTNLTLSSSKYGSENYEYHIGGWSPDYVLNNLNGNQLAIGFDSVTGWGATNPNHPKSCEYGHCTSGGSKADVPAAITPVFPEAGNLNLQAGNYASVCPADNSGIYCRSELDDDGNIVVTITSDVASLSVQGGWLNGKTVNMIVQFEAGYGTYGRMIGSYTTNNNVITRFPNAGTYTFNTLNFNTNTELETGKDVVWLINNSLTFSNSVIFTNTETTDDFIVFAPNDGSKITFNNIVNPFYGLVLGDTVNFTNNFTLHGAVTANTLTMATNNSAIVGNSECFSESEEDLYLEIREEKQFALLCENPEFSFSVRDANNDNEIDTDYAGAIEVTLPSGISVDSIVKGSGSNGSYTPVNGELILSFSASSYGTYTIEGELSTDSSKDDSSELYVAPYKFDSDTVSAIAGNNTAFSLSVLACNDGSATKVSGYDGSKTLTRSDVTLEQPTSSEGGVTGNLTVAGTSSTSISFDFNNGAASSSLNYDESGAISFILSDSTFTCPTGFDCETDDGAEWESLKGVVNVNTRPWTFAICEPNSHSMNGTSSSGDGFVAAGESFTLNVLPIRYQGGSTSGDILVGDSYCNSSYVTKNFFNSSSPSATINLLGKLSSPSGGLTGDSTLVTSGYDKLNTDHNNEQYQYTNLSWDEVGSLDIGVDTAASYFGMDINRGYREVGRFYPNHLSVEDHSWTYASGHDDFAYMSQPIGHSFTVEAMNADGEPVANYRLFSDSLIADMRYYSVQSSTDLIGRIDGTDQNSNSIKATWGGSSDWELVTDTNGTQFAQMNINSSDFIFVKNPDAGATNYTTVPDGPYDSSNSEFGLEITSRTEDNVSFSSDRNNHADISVFDVQPDFRYGRMKLSDVGGNTDTLITVPLATEYWTGTTFITNPDDSGSEFDTRDYCRQTIWRAEAGTSSATFISSGTDTVEEGESEQLVATHGGDSREQVRLWLRQQSTEPDGLSSSDCFNSGSIVNQPWLRYNWRNSGDEDPSAVIVFGIYRGNDRIIFRGETRLTEN